LLAGEHERPGGQDGEQLKARLVKHGAARGEHPLSVGVSLRWCVGSALDLDGQDPDRADRVADRRQDARRQAPEVRRRRSREQTVEGPPHG
jgi:hypothetical protein